MGRCKGRQKTKTVDIIWRLAVSDGGIKGSNPKLSPVPYNDLVNLTKMELNFIGLEMEVAAGDW